MEDCNKDGPYPEEFVTTASSFWQGTWTGQRRIYSLNGFKFWIGDLKLVARGIGGDLDGAMMINAGSMVLGIDEPWRNDMAACVDDFVTNDPVFGNRGDSASLNTDFSDHVEISSHQRGREECEQQCGQNTKSRLNSLSKEMRVAGRVSYRK